MIEGFGENDQITIQNSLLSAEKNKSIFRFWFYYFFRD